MITCHENRGIDYHLRTLGLQKRRHWKIIAADDNEFATKFIVCRPDWLLQNEADKYYLILEYKNRLLDEGGATEYEAYQSTINQIVIAQSLCDELGYCPEVKGILLYGNNRKLEVAYTEADFTLICETSLEYGSGLSKTPIAATRLAAILSGTDFSAVPAQFTKRGTAAHHAMLNFGPSMTV